MEQHQQELADSIAYQAEAIAKGRVTNAVGAVRLLRNNVETLEAWITEAGR